MRDVVYQIPDRCRQRQQTLIADDGSHHCQICPIKHSLQRCVVSVRPVVTMLVWDGMVRHYRSQVRGYKGGGRGKKTVQLGTLRKQHEGQLLFGLQMITDNHCIPISDNYCISLSDNYCLSISDNYCISRSDHYSITISDIYHSTYRFDNSSCISRSNSYCFCCQYKKSENQ